MGYVMIAPGGDESSASRIFFLNENPSVLALGDDPKELSNVHDGNAVFSPLASALFVRMQMAGAGTMGIKMKADEIEGRKTDVMLVSISNAEKWHDPNFISMIDGVFEQRLPQGKAIIVTPDLREKFSGVTSQELQDHLDWTRPETVAQHNEALDMDTESAIRIADNGWNPETGDLAIIMGQACGSGDESVCSIVNKYGTQQALKSYMTRRFPGVKVYFP